jgi:tetratricopeptide (TPR) repeat protein
VDLSQLARKELATGSWRQGQVDNALLLIDSVVSEEMSPPVAAECFVTQAVFRAEKGDYQGSLLSLGRAAPYIDTAPIVVQGAYFNQRARAHKEMGNLDAALLDYGGAAWCYESAGRRDNEGGVAINVAGLCLKIGDLSRATANIERAITIYSSIDSDYLSQAYDTQANILLAQEKFSLALRSCDKAIALVGENDVWLQTFLVTRGKVKARLSDHSARQDFDGAIELAKQLGLPAGIVAACCALIQFLALPVEDLVSYYQMADVYGGPELEACARIVIGLFIPHGTVEEVQVDMVRRALVKCEGRITKAASLIGMSPKGVSYVVNQHQSELAHLRKEPRIRRKSIIKKI